MNSLLAGVARAAIRTDVQAAVGVVDTAVSGACGNGTLEAVLVSPALEVVTVEAITSRVTHSPDESVGVLDGSSVVEKLVEDGQDSLRVRLRAHAKIVVANGGESNVALVVAAVQVLAVPAGREESLGTKTGAGKLGHFGGVALACAI